MKIRVFFAELRKLILSRENKQALVLCLFLIILLVISVDTSPPWIYQSF